MWQPRTYIVRLYPDGPGRTSGLLEEAGNGRRARFADKDELWALLHRPRLMKAAQRGTGRPHPGQPPAGAEGEMSGLPGKEE